MGYLGGELYSSLREEIGLFNGLVFLVDNLQCTKGVVIIITAENLCITAVVYIAVLLNKAVILCVQSVLQYFQLLVGAVISLCGKHFTECITQLVQSFYTLRFLACFSNLRHNIVFTEIHLSVNLGKGKVADIFHSGNNTGLLFCLLRPFLYSISQLQSADSLFKLFRKDSSLNGNTGGFGCIAIQRKLHALFHRAEYHFGVVKEIAVYGNTLVVLAYIAPIGHFHSHFLTLLQEYYIGCYLCSCVRFESVVRQTDSADKVSSFRKVLTDLRILLVKRSLCCDESYNAVRSYLVQRFCKEIVVNVEILLIVTLVEYSIRAKRNVADSCVKVVVGESSFLIALNLNIRCLI